MDYLENDTYERFNYFVETDPNRFNLLCLLHKIRPKEIKSACELGFGYGISLNINACKSEVSWYGVDFNKDQAKFVKQMSEECKNGATVYNESFEAFSKRKDLPKFDFIVLHGIYSCINRENQEFIKTILTNNLSNGGGVYISYNTTPGSNSLRPFRDLLKSYADTLPLNMSPSEKVIQGIGFIDAMIAANAASINEGLKKQIEHYKSLDISYLAHEFLNDSWLPNSFLEIAEDMDACGLNFLSSATYSEGAIGDNFQFTTEQLNMIHHFADAKYKEHIKNYMRNTNFRRDYFIKGGEKLSDKEFKELFLKVKIALKPRVDKIDYSLLVNNLKWDLDEKHYKNLVNIMSDYCAISIGELMKKAEIKDFGIMEESIRFMLAKEFVDVTEIDTKETKAKTHAFNLQLEKNLNKEIINIASPVLSDLPQIGLETKLIFIALLNGIEDDEAIAKFVLQKIKELNLTLKEDEKTTIKNLKEMAKEYKINYLTRLKAQKVLD